MIGHRQFRFLGVLVLLTSVAMGCAPAPSTPDLNVQLTQAVQTAFAAIRQTQTAEVVPATQTPADVPAAPQTPPELAATFTTNLLDATSVPHTYIQDSCEYLKEKWTSTNAAPGTVVMVIMFHTINKDVATAANEISQQDFQQLMNDLHEQGFQAIYMQELEDFLYSNARIPPRSVLLIQDDRHFAQNFIDHFQTYYQKWGWPVINGWISTPLSSADLWQQQVDLEQQGWVDYEAHGVQHLPIDGSSSDSYILGELQGSVDAFKQHFNKTPIAFIWPGGGFTPHAVELARTVGYKLGFTVNPRGPLMYNWIPLADQIDPGHPLAIPEGPVNDPLMVLPRYWDTDARAHLDTVRLIGQAAAAYAEQQKPNEISYYNIVCAPNYGPLP